MVIANFSLNNRQINTAPDMNKSITAVSSYIEPIDFRGNVAPEKFTNHTNMKSLSNNTIKPAIQQKSHSSVSQIQKEKTGNSSLPECSEAHILSLIHGCLS